jgi:hypothetical protein
MLRKMLNGLIVLAMLLAFPQLAFAQDGTVPVVPTDDVSEWLIPEGTILDYETQVDTSLAAATGDVEVVVKLADDPVSVAATKKSASGRTMSGAGQSNYEASLGQRQSGLMQGIAALGGRELGRTSIALNAVIVSIPAENIVAVSKLAGVKSVRPVRNYEVDLSETVPYIGATALQNAGFDGTGIRVAVLDSGIDYIHYNLGGSGNVAEYDANDPTVIEPGTFPTWKVVGGYDFVGETWPNGDRTEDPDPLDKGTGAGHGTHVADIIGGKSLDGKHVGVAPGASLYAVKVCSSVATSCNGVALLLAMDYALDPNGDGNIADAVDVVNMSLGSDYGQKEDDLSEASANAVKLGVVVVTSAGNGANKPYVLGSPSSTPEVISVAQTQTPGSIAIPLVINSPAAIAGVYANTATVEWAPIGAGFTGDVVYIGRACPGDTLLADPTGKVALVDRGSCSISLKVDVAGDAGAIGMLLGLVAPGDAVSFSYGGGDNMIPTLVIIKAYADLIKANLAAPVNVTVSPASAIPLVGSMASTSSRGPSISYQAIKPDIAAPGASVSAVLGTGNGEAAFGGTSGAAPMVSGAVALLLDARPDLLPVEVKALLVNTGETEIYTNPALLPGELAPITRIGGGEVRVDRAVAAMTIVGNKADYNPSLSFGYQPIIGKQTFTKTVLVYNYTGKTRKYSIDPQFRFADDMTGAVKLSAPKSITVPGKSYKTFTFTLTVDAKKLPDWTLNGGVDGGNGALLNEHEFDGYIFVKDSLDNVHVPWHILPQKSANVVVVPTKLELNGKTKSVKLINALGATDGDVDIFAWTGSSTKIPSSELPGPGDNFAMIDLRSVGVRPVDFGDGDYGIQFAVTTFGIRPHPAYPAEFDVYVDTNRDGTDDFVIYTSELGGFSATGQVLVYVVDLATGAGGAYFYADASLDSSNIILTAPLDALGMDLDTQFDFSVYAFDNYFTGALTDSIEAMTHTLSTPRFTTDVAEVTVAPNDYETVKVSPVVGGDTASPSQKGILFMFRNAYLKGNFSLESFELPVKP